MEQQVTYGSPKAVESDAHTDRVSDASEQVPVTLPPATYDTTVQRYGTTPTQQPFIQYGRVDVAVTTLLCLITFGIYYLVWIYKNMTVYRALSGRQGANMTQLFWGLTIAVSLTVLFSWTIIGGILLSVAIVALQIILTSQMLDDRIAIGQRYGFATEPPSKSLIMGVLIATMVSPYLIVALLITVPLAAWYLVLFFRGHNVVVDGLARAAMAGIEE